MEYNSSSPFIDGLVKDYNKIQEVLLVDDPSTAQNISIHLTKILILMCASYYEQLLTEAYVEYAKRESDSYGDRPHGFDDDQRNKSIYQKFKFGKIEGPEEYNQLPDTKNLLEPLKVFGERFRDKIYSEINGDTEKERQLKDFQELFALRNLLAHQTYVEFTSNRIRGKTFLDIKQMHENAMGFVIYLKNKFI